MLVLFAADCKTENISISRGTFTSSSTSFALIYCIDLQMKNKEGFNIKEMKPQIISYIYMHPNRIDGFTVLKNVNWIAKFKI